MELILNFCFSEFHFQFEFFFNIDFQMHKTHLESFVFNILFIGDNNLTLFHLGGGGRERNSPPEKFP